MAKKSDNKEQKVPEKRLSDFLPKAQGKAITPKSIFQAVIADRTSTRMIYPPKFWGYVGILLCIPPILLWKDLYKFTMKEHEKYTKSLKDDFTKDSISELNERRQRARLSEQFQAIPDTPIIPSDIKEENIFDRKVIDPKILKESSFSDYSPFLAYNPSNTRS